MQGFVVHACLRFEALLFAAQVEEQFALRLGGGHFDHAPIFENVLVDLCFDPVHGIAHQAHTLVRVKAAHGFHQTDIAFLNQVTVGQAIAQILAGHRNHQAQMRHDETPSSI